MNFQPHEFPRLIDRYSEAVHPRGSFVRHREPDARREVERERGRIPDAASSPK
jgi:hypothetical protein